MTINPGTLTTAIGDRVWLDANKNGIQDAGETGVAGVTVKLLDGVGRVLATQQTDANGNYLFTGLGGGQYAIEVVKPGDYSFTLRDVGPDTTDSDVDTVTGRSGMYTLALGEQNLSVDVGLQAPPCDCPPTASLGDRVWVDSNANGQQDAGEAGLSNVIVKLLNAAGVVVATTTTDANGNYLFTNLAAGQYAVEFTKPSGYTLTGQNIGADVTDSDANTVTGRTGLYTLAAGEQNLTVDAGVYKTASLGDRVWNDTNGNGVQDTGETGASGVKVELYNCITNVLVATTTTDANGNYLFANLIPGTYHVKFYAPTGTQFTTVDVGNDALDSDANPSTGITGCYTLKSGDINTSVDAGLKPLNTASLGDRVWLDTNGNGQQDAGEAGVANVTVKLLNAAGAVIATQTTDANGNYLFNNLAAGQYAVEFTKPSGYTLTGQNIGADVTDSDANTVTGRTGLYTLAAGEQNLTVDAGVYKTASLGDRVWNDTNGNGVQDTGETGASGVKVELYNCITNVLVATTTTDANGNYLFANLIPGTYHVKFYAPTGTQFTTVDVGNDALDSDANPSTGITGCYTLKSGDINTSVDAGLKPLNTASLGDRVWLDTNGNGQQDAGEAGVANVTVKLLNAAGAVIATQTTDANGNYLFNNLAAGQYAVEFTKPTGYNFTSQNTGADATDSDANTTTGRTGLYTLAAGEQNLTVDAGLKVANTASLGDRVWLDTNGNGVQDTGENGIANVTVNLLNAAGTVVGTKTTDANGNYLFTDLAPGQYAVQFVKPNGLQFTTANVGNDGLDSDANVTTGKTGLYTLTSGQQNLTVDAGLKAPPVTLERDAVSVCEDLSKTFNVLANDSGAGLKLINVRHETTDLDSLFQSRAGAISFTADGNVTYKTMTNYYGNDRLVYTVQDAAGRTFDQYVDITVKPVSDAPTAGNGAHYHPGEWDFAYGSQGVSHWQHIYTYADFGDFIDAADKLQQFGTLNTGTPSDIDTRVAFVVYGLQGASAQYGKILYDGVALDFSQGQSYEISVADVQAKKLVLDFTNQYVDYSMDFANKDSGSIENNACYDGEIYSNIRKITIITPVALDLNGDGHIGVTGATSSYQKDAGAALGHTVSFDIDADGKKDTIEWFNGSGDGILIDNRDGLAASHMDGSRLFGGQDGYGNGYYKMAALDANQDGKLSGAELKGIELWVDNGDAVVQAGEIQTLAQHGIDAVSTQLNLTYDAQGKLHIESTAARTDGSTLMSEDVFFAQENPTAPLPTIETVLNFGDGPLSKLLAGFMGGLPHDIPTERPAVALEHAADGEMLRKLIEVVNAQTVHAVAA